MEQAKQDALDSWRESIAYVVKRGHTDEGPTWLAWAFARVLEFMQMCKAQGDTESLQYIKELLK